MRLSARSEYGLLAMIELAGRIGEGPASAREISEVQAIPPKFLEQLLVTLRKAGLVTAVRGARGGFVLDGAPEDISVLQIIEVLDGPLSPTVCDDERAAACGKSGACAAGTVWNRATRALREVFEETTLADLASEQRRMDSHK